ncbi:MAG: glycosyltransferase [Planctomycetaceae bacterium]|nr:glycosyltransferase [Planctomycetaceae bacterium]
MNCPGLTRISILLPTRQRPQGVARLLDSLADHADAPEGLEVVLYVDHDDLASQSISHDRIAVVTLVRPRAKMGQMLRTCYAASSGRCIILLNDDAVCRTGGWDSAVLAALEAFGDGIGLVWCNDLYRGDSMPVFPIFSRRTCEALDGPSPADYSHDYIDTHLFDIFVKLRALGVDRMAYLPQVVIEHMHHEVGKAAFDAVYDKAARVRDELTFIAWEESRQIAAKALAATIRQGAPCDS